MALAAEAGHPAPGRAYLRSRAAALLDGLVAFWIFSGGMVITEPSPYELSFLMVLGVAIFAGLGLYRSTLGLLVLFVAFIPFALIAAFQVKYNDLTDALIFQAVTIFLIFTAYFVANYVVEAPQPRMRLIVNAYIATALISATVGTFGYLGVIPGGELFTKFGRAKAFFNDPNVYGPFLILPAMYVLQRVLLGTRRRAFWGGVIFMVLLVGVFVSFSRAAWGHLAASSLLVFALIFFLEAHALEKVRMLLTAMAGLLLVVVAIAGMLSIPSVSELFEVRAASQNYDEGETGRFGRQGYAFELARDNPLGIGPNEFYQMRIMEAPHNTYVTVLHVYGWGGGLVFLLLMGITIWRGVSYLARPSPNRLLLIPLISVFIPLCIEAAIIDLDHWRHFFLVIGLIWGVTAAYDRVPKEPLQRHSGLL
ncbi:MAG TPA: O-antigen ligase family protein [Devosiaceae bacterium]|nr:O-antigen ligase family protein [Devosiaceae bacterium]